MVIPLILFDQLRIVFQIQGQAKSSVHEMSSTKFKNCAELRTQWKDNRITRQHEVMIRKTVTKATRKNTPMPLSFASVGRLALCLTLGCFAALPQTMYSQTAASPTAPTATEDPNVIDQAWQKASAKYDAPRSALLKEVDRMDHQGPYRHDSESLQKYEAPEWYKD